jgi:hypothetical protein
MWDEVTDVGGLGDRNKMFVLRRMRKCVHKHLARNIKAM